MSQNHEVHMAWPVWMTIQLLEQLSYRPIVRDRIWHRNNRLEPEVPRVIACQHRSAIWTAPICVLHVSGDRIEVMNFFDVNSSWLLQIPIAIRRLRLIGFNSGF
jgi:hypothetical protein